MTSDPVSNGTQRITKKKQSAFEDGWEDNIGEAKGNRGDSRTRTLARTSGSKETTINDDDSEFRIIAKRHRASDIEEDPAFNSDDSLNLLFSGSETGITGRKSTVTRLAVTTTSTLHAAAESSQAGEGANSSSRDDRHATTRHVTQPREVAMIELSDSSSDGPSRQGRAELRTQIASDPKRNLNMSVPLDNDTVEPDPPVHTIRYTQAHSKARIVTSRRSKSKAPRAQHNDDDEIEVVEVDAITDADAMQKRPKKEDGGNARRELTVVVDDSDHANSDHAAEPPRPKRRGRTDKGDKSIGLNKVPHALHADWPAVQSTIAMYYDDRANDPHDANGPAPKKERMAKLLMKLADHFAPRLHYKVTRTNDDKPWNKAHTDHGNWLRSFLEVAQTAVKRGAQRANKNLNNVREMKEWAEDEESPLGGMHWGDMESNPPRLALQSQYIIEVLASHVRKTEHSIIAPKEFPSGAFLLSYIQGAFSERDRDRRKR